MEQLIQKTEEFVFQLFADKLPKEFLYHNFEHTQYVVMHAKELIRGLNLPQDQANLLILAAWLHDIGYTKGVVEHEKESAKMAEEFLTENGLGALEIEGIKNLILATEVGHTPQNLLEEMIRDADCAHFGSDNYNNISNKLRKEWNLLGSKTFTDLAWTEENLKFATEFHQFYTDYAKEHWQPGKMVNIERLEKRKKKQKARQVKEEIKEKYKNKYKDGSPERGVQTFYRVALRNHMSLSQIADTKANILLSVNAIIISLVLSNLISKLDNPSNQYLIVPTIVFTVFSVISMVLSVLATRPNITSGKFTIQDVENKQVNLAFFGNFHKMKLNEYQWGVNELTRDKDYLYDTLAKDLYFLGVVLHKKYKLLRITYTWFMIGIILSVISFGISFYLQSKGLI